MYFHFPNSNKVNKLNKYTTNLVINLEHIPIIRTTTIYTIQTKHLQSLKNSKLVNKHDILKVCC